MKLYGKNTVIERLRSNPKTIKRIYVQEGFDAVSYVLKKAHKWNIPISVIPRSKMIKLARDINAQGVIIEADDFSYRPLDEILATKNITPVFLDSLNDPQNLGAIIRSLACLGNFAIILPTHDSVDVTETVLRIASGADNYIPVTLVSNLANAIKEAKEAGFWIAGAVVEEGEPLTETKLNFPLALVMGSEQKGIRDVILKTVDIKITIPMRAGKLSMNVSHATTIFAYEIIRQKKANH